MTHATAQGWCEGCPGHRPQQLSSGCPRKMAGLRGRENVQASMAMTYGFPESIHDNNWFARARPKIKLYSVEGERVVLRCLADNCRIWRAGRSWMPWGYTSSLD